MRIKYIFLIVLVSILYSCNFFQKSNVVKKNAIAKYNGNYLYQEELLKMLPVNYNKKDSLLIVNNIIDDWAKRKILIYKAKINLKEKQTEINELVNKYKEDLLINKYREAVVLQNLDTIINKNDIDKFYDNNKEILVLNENLIKIKFIQIGKDIINKKIIKKQFYSNKKEDIDALLKKEMVFKSFHLNDSIWVKYTDVLKFIPPLKKSNFNTIKNGSSFKLEDNNDVYFIKINNKINKNNVSPKSYIIPTIKQMILHTRKLELLKKIEKTILIDANKKGKYEKFK